MIATRRFHPPTERREPRRPAERSAEHPPPGCGDRARRSAGGSFRRPGLLAAPRTQAGPAARAYALLSALHCVGAVGATAQQAPASDPYVLELEMRDRWVHEGQHPGFVTFEETRTPIQLRLQSSVLNDRGRRLELRVRNRDVRMWLDSINRMRSISIVADGWPAVPARGVRLDRRAADRHLAVR